MNIVLKFRWIWVLLLVVCVAAVSPGLPTAVETDNALTVWFLESDPQLKTYQQFQDEFGNDEVILLHIENDAGIFTTDVLRDVEALSQAVESIEGVARVHSILTVQDAWDTEEGLVFRSLIPDPVPDDDELIESAGKRTVNNPLFVDRLVDPEGTQTMIWAEMDVMDDIDAMRDRVVAEVREEATQVMGEEKVAMAGVGVIYSGLNVLTERDFGIFLSVSYLLMFILMWLIFRNLRIVAAAIGVITVGTLISLGLYGLFGHQMNMVTVVIPILVIVLGIADAVHMPSTFFTLRRDNPSLSSPELVVRTLRYVALPSLLTTLTTMGSFLALTSSPMAVIRNLGIYSAIGIGAALLATIALMTIALAGLDVDDEPPQHELLRGLLDWVGALLRTRRTLVATLLALVVALAAWGSTNVDVDTYTLGYLPDDNPVVVDHHKIEEMWGPYSLLEFVVHPREGLSTEDPEVLEAIERFVARAMEHELVRNGFSLADVYRRSAAVYMGELDEPPDLSEPLTPAQVEQLGLLLSMQRLEWDRDQPGYDDNFMARVTNYDRDLGRITLTSDMVSAQTLDDLFGWLDEVSEETMDGVATVEPAGYPPLYTKIIEHVMSSKVLGFFLALLIIFAMLLIGLRSLRLALIGLPANVFPVLVMMGAMGALQIDLDIGTATVGAIVLGIAIDDSVHFLHHWKQAEGQGLSWEECITHTFRHAGMAALITTAILVGGFPVLMLADVKTVFYFGLLTTIAAAAALIADLFVLPLLLKWFPGRQSPR